MERVVTIVHFKGGYVWAKESRYKDTVALAEWRVGHS